MECSLFSCCICVALRCQYLYALALQDSTWLDTWELIGSVMKLTTVILIDTEAVDGN